MKIEVLGTGCPKCNQLEQTAKAAADRLGLTYELVHVKDINEIVRRGVMLTPALAVDGQVKVSGQVPSIDEISKLLV
ncbi:MAG TPA: thioredoxin family protein [Phycisphaerae bacterium]|nr:TM0996/MTH895 family glutaredoxin-like protein [Phycisphaerales bacterium]HRX86089.1 thioredoxin family protein [Phycisphaerae bacterium]